MLKRLFIAFVTILVAGSVMAQAYRWVDEDGIVHYSDRPHEGAERIILSTNRTTTTSRRPATRRSVTAAEPVSSAADAVTYQSITINTPAAEETLWNIEGILNVTLSLVPALKTGHRVRVYFDGEPTMVSGTSFQLEEVYRGVHNLQAEVLDETGTLMIRSRPNRFYVQQNAIGH